MDAKITKKRLSRMLSYDWIKILLTIAAAVLVWMLIFTMTATRITPAQQFTVFNYLGNVSFNDTKFLDLYNEIYSDGTFSYEVLEINNNDIPSTAEYASTIMEARLATNEGDVIFVSSQPNTSSEKIKNEETGEEYYQYSYAESLLVGYFHQMYQLDPEKQGSYFYNMEAYLNNYYKGDWTKSENLEEAKVSADFYARAKNDKRFKTDEQKKAGEAKDIQRIKDYRDALEQFYGYLNAGVIEFVDVKMENVNSQEVTIEGTYYINICPSSDAQNRMEKLSEYVCYTTDVVEKDPQTGEDKVTENVRKADDMLVGFFHLNEMTEGFQYENVLFINALIEKTLALGNA